MANGGHPWRLQAEIKRQKEEKREDGKNKKEGGDRKVLPVPLWYTEWASIRGSVCLCPLLLSRDSHSWMVWSSSSQDAPCGIALITGGKMSTLQPADARASNTKLKRRWTLRSSFKSKYLLRCWSNYEWICHHHTRTGKVALLEKAIHRSAFLQPSLAVGCVCSCQEDAGKRPSEASWVNLSMLLSHWAINMRWDFVITGP